MTQRFFQSFLRLLLSGALLSALLLAAVGARASDEIDILHASLEAGEEGHKLAASYGFVLNNDLEEAITRGITLYFKTEVELTRRRWYWLDEKAASISQTTRLAYNVLTRQFSVGTVGHVQHTFSTLEDALALIRRPGRLLVAPKGALKPGETYSATLQMSLNLEYLPKPFQINAINNSGWKLSSDKKRFTYKVEEK